LAQVHQSAAGDTQIVWCCPMTNITVSWQEGLLQLNQTDDKVEALLRTFYAFYKVQQGTGVLAMQIGFGCLEAGSVPGEAVGLTLFKNFVDFTIAGVVWPFAGRLAAFDGLTDEEFFFHFTFAATACTVVSGAIACRTKVKSYFVYTAINTGVLYAMVARWFWGQEFLLPSGWGIDRDKTFVDFAGSGVVHLFAGSCALAAIIIIGPRQSVKAPHSYVLVYFGAMLLMIGWLAFNGGSFLFDESDDTDPFRAGPKLGRVCSNSVLAASAGTITAYLLSSVMPQFFWWKFSPAPATADRQPPPNVQPVDSTTIAALVQRQAEAVGRQADAPSRAAQTSSSQAAQSTQVQQVFKRWRQALPKVLGPDGCPVTHPDNPTVDFCGVANGMLAGLVAVTASCDRLEEWQAVILGAVGSAACCTTSCLMVVTCSYRKTLGHSNRWPWNWNCFQRCRITLRHRNGDPNDEDYWLDDVVGAVPVHMAAGLVGTLGPAIFPKFDLQQLAVQAVGALIIFVVGFFGTLIVMFFMRWMQDGGYWRAKRQQPPEDGRNTSWWTLTVSKNEEGKGVDWSEMGGTALEYLLMQYKDDQEDDGTSTDREASRRLDDLEDIVRRLEEKLREEPTRMRGL